ncbi:hypothetical protein [Mycobacterium sp.]|uniref:hypothetical protein n=1 Tax=Mycobacterium sp. TaxID=1785 RepID=UPI003D0D23BE
MYLTTRPLITAAVVLVGVNAVAVTPVAAASPDALVRAVQLTSFDPNNWLDVLQLASTNATDIYDHFAPAPFPDLQQFAANLPTYFEGTRSISSDLTAAGNAAIVPFEPTNPEPYIYPSLDPTSSNIGISLLGAHLFDIPLPGKAGLLDLLTNGLQFTIGICPLCTHVDIDVLALLIGQTAANQVEPYLNFVGSPLSGVLWGDIGTTLGPTVQFDNDVTAIGAALSGPTPDYMTALQELLNMPANVTNAFLNGYGNIDLSTLLNDFGAQLPASDANFVLDLGGLLSPAGSLLNGIGFSETLGDCSIGCATLDVPTSAVGPIASMIGLDQAIAEAIGWDGVGNPLAGLLSELTGGLL